MPVRRQGKQAKPIVPARGQDERLAVNLKHLNDQCPVKPRVQIVDHMIGDGHRPALGDVQDG